LKILKYLLGFIVTLGVLGVIIGLFAFMHFSKEVKLDADKLINYHPEMTTRIYDRNGELIANIFKDKHRLYAPFEEIPPRLIEALVAIEDTVFFEHEGVNYEAILRALLKDIKAGKMKEGASTLTQQLVKNTLLTSEKKLQRKINEAILALKLETKLSKEEILERYLNEIYFGHRYYGVKTAALGYFRKPLHDLNLKEIAMLVGLPQAPSKYDPTRHYDISMSRANTVLMRMRSLGWITEEELQKYQAMRPTVYNDSLTQNRLPYVVDQVLKDLREEYPDIRTGGYKIYTTIDSSLQALGKEALAFGHQKILERGADKEGIDYSDLNGAMVVLDSHSGEVLVLIGGVDYKKSAYNRATQSKRQPGSSFKPFIYQIALDSGYSLKSTLMDISRTFKYQDKDEEKEWQPKNYEKNFEGLITLHDALVHSRNLATINLVNTLGLNLVHRKITEMGFKNVPNDLSISLGTFGISPLEMSSMYTIFSNYGVKMTPILVKSVVNYKGEEKIYEAKSEKITKPEQAFLTTTILEDVIKQGTGRRARVKGLALAGKTGTTNDYKDAWFCGYSPEIEAIVWYGKDDNKPMYKETGGKAAGPAFAYFFKEYLALHPETKTSFDIPDGVRVVRGKKGTDYFTKISKPPKETQNTPAASDGELLF
jgi:penicillin-binding protein 1A